MIQWHDWKTLTVLELEIKKLGDFSTIKFSKQWLVLTRRNIPPRLGACWANSSSIHADHEVYQNSDPHHLSILKLDGVQRIQLLQDLRGWFLYAISWYGAALPLLHHDWRSHVHGDAGLLISHIISLNITPQRLECTLHGKTTLLVCNVTVGQVWRNNQMFQKVLAT